MALHHYLSWHSVVPPPRTILSGVKKLPPATVRTCQPDGTWSDRQYWDPPSTRPETGRSPQEWNEEVLEAMRKAVARRMVSDVPVGVLLSGGLDSSLVVALLAEAGQSGLATFSIGFNAKGGETGDEFEYSDLVAKEFGTDHHQIPIEDSRLVPGVEASIGAMSEPMVSHDCVAFYLLSEEVSKKIKVVQSGQGADEVFAGYDWYPPLAGVPVTRPRRSTAGPSSTGPTPRPAGCSTRSGWLPVTPAVPSCASTSVRRGRRPRWTRRCGWTPG